MWALGREDELIETARRTPVETRWLAAAVAIASGDPGGAADIFAEMGHVPEEAWARLHAAATLVAAGRRAAGEAELRRALAFYRRVGATAYVRKGERLLAASA